MGWFDKRSRAEKAELKKHKERQKSVKRANKRELTIGELKDRTRLLKAKAEYKKAKSGGKSRSLVSVSISKKKQGGKLSQKRRVSLF